MSTQHKEVVVNFNGASAIWSNGVLKICTGDFSREWLLTERGLATSRLESGKICWQDRKPENSDCDWRIDRLLESTTQCELIDVRIEKIESPPLIAPHILVNVELVYPDSDIALLYDVKVFPNAPGIRTQLCVRTLRVFGKKELPGHMLDSYAESLSFNTADCEREAIGYYNDPQHRNSDDTPIIRREKHSGNLSEGCRELYEWANILDVKKNKNGLLFVKESNKCVNQKGIDTGAFVLHPEELKVTGLGLKETVYMPGTESLYLTPDRFRKCWANWCIPYSGGEAERQLALKRFDRACFNPYPAERTYSRSNTWGTRLPGLASSNAANQEDIIKEIASCADIGIDTVAIDDGYQKSYSGVEMDGKWNCHPEKFPNGWSAVKKAAEESGVDLDLWMPPTTLTLANMISLIEEGGFTGLKLDFYHFPDWNFMDNIMRKIEALEKYFQYKIKISWDVTENGARLGYYFGREYGSLHTSNRRATFEEEPNFTHIVYTPRLILRDAWHLSHFLNLNQIEIPVQDISNLDPAVSNAGKYNHAYCAAMSVAGMPLFFQETHFLQGKAREETKTVMQAWKKHCKEMANSYVFPLGDEPCDESWTGFQCHNPDTESGYILLFRELKNSQVKNSVSLNFVDDKNLKWTDVLNENDSAKLESGKLECCIPEAPGFLWLKYENISK